MKEHHTIKDLIIEELKTLRKRVQELDKYEEDRQRIHAALRESEKKYQQIYDETPVGYHELDTKGRFTRVNRTELQMLGYSAGEMLGKPVWDFFEEEDTTRKVILAKLSGDVSFHDTFERTYRRKDGSTILVLVEDRVLRDKGNQIIGIRSMVEDITERRRAEEALRKSEEQLRQWQRVEAIGRLAGGVAHDFNNLLMTIKGCSELLLGAFDRRDPRREEVEEILKAADRATSLTRQLLAFGRRQILQPQVLDLNAVVMNMDKMLRRVIGEDVQLIASLRRDLWSVKVDPGMIEQVIMNLAVNSRDAMPNGGKLTIETTNVTHDEEYASHHVSVKPGYYAMLAITDTGCGMDKETQSHLFEPFFTTKEKGKGSGLGLSTVYGIIKQSGGNIWTYSEPGLGTTFKIYLPRVEETSHAYKPEISRKEIKAPGGTETVLLVEDEEAVRSMVSKVLQNKGYRVLEASHGNEALEVCDKFEGPIHLMVTDVIMPQMSGRELAERLALVRPEMGVLYMSGYPDNTIVQHGVLEPGTAFLQKPFTISALELKVREILDSGPPGDRQPQAFEQISLFHK
ncbi:MAG TPA: PAS domain S-box protein [Thermodesulfobacteriota bacterium]|nr:PAS domain S-box protein [Thermodesulfobacteriota bacterium]